MHLLNTGYQTANKSDQKATGDSSGSSGSSLFGNAAGMGIDMDMSMGMSMPGSYNVSVQAQQKLSQTCLQGLFSLCAFDNAPENKDSNEPTATTRRRTASNAAADLPSPSHLEAKSSAVVPSSSKDSISADRPVFEGSNAFAIATMALPILMSRCEEVYAILCSA